MKIKTKLLLPVSLMLIIAIATVTISILLLYASYVNDTMTADLLSDIGVAEDKLESLYRQAEMASRLSGADAALKEAMIAGDHERLALAGAEAVRRTGVDFLTVTDEQGVVLLRAHEPDHFGDSVVGQENVKQALAGNVYTTLETGTAVKLSVRSGSPIYAPSGELIGVASCGFRLDTDSFVDQVKALTDSEITVFLQDERISTTVIGQDGKRAVGTKAAEAVSEKVLQGSAYSGEAQVVGRSAMVAYHPIASKNGTIVGMLFAGKYSDDRDAVIIQMILRALITALVLFAAVLPPLVYLINKIVNPIKTMVGIADRLARGDIDVEINASAKDEVGMLASSLRTMIGQMRAQAQAISEISEGDLRVEVARRSDKDVVNNALSEMLDNNNNVFQQVVTAAGQVAAGSGQVAQSAQQLAQSNTEQASVVENLQRSMVRISGDTRRNAEMAGESAALSESIRTQALRSSEQMHRMVGAVQEINAASKAIGKVIKTIDDIAFQTNILALNASVEASHAGQNGKGFAVVAEQVRELAGKSAVAAKDTGSLIANSIEKAELGTRIAGETSKDLTRIVESIERSTVIAEEISAYTNSQMESIENFNMSIDQVSQVLQLTSSLSEETAAASEEITSQAKLLHDLVDHFKLRGDRPLSVEHASKPEFPRY